MIDIILLLTVVLGCTALNILTKSYGLKHPEGGALTFCAFSCITVCFFFLVSGGFELKFDLGLIPYVIGFGISYGLGTIMAYYAIRTGSLSLTSLITSYSLVIPTFYGLFFLGDDVGILFYIGLVLLFVSLFLIGIKKDESEGEVKISPVWVLCVTLAFLGNGLCSTFQTAQQKAFLGEYKNELMIFSLIFVSIALLVLALIVERRVFISTVKSCFGYALGYGVLNGLANLCVMLLTGGNRLSTAIIFPSISAGQIVTAVIFAIIIYKEKLSKSDIASVILGTAAVILMNV